MADTYGLGLDSILSSPKIQVTAPLVIEAFQLAIFPADACSPTGLNNVENVVPKGDCQLSIKDRAYIQAMAVKSISGSTFDLLNQINSKYSTDGESLDTATTTTLVPVQT